MRKNIFKITFLLFAGFGFSQSTELPNLAPKSPEAAAFQKYGDYPVDLSTGVPNISIPLYTIKTGSYELPISLSYHSSGIKVADEASWVGLGWNLNSGAQIILDVRDRPDEYNINSYNDIPDANDVNTYISNNPNSYYQNYILNLRNESWVRDVYYFSSPTTSGKFIINQANPLEVTIYPPDAFKVENYIGGYGTGKRFKITDQFGNVYIFNNTRELSETLQQNQEATYTSAWFVDKIETPNHDIIEFTYEDGGEIFRYNYGEVVNHTTTIIPHFQCISGALPYQETLSGIQNSTSILYTSTKKIKEINFNNGRVVFNSSSGRLDFYNPNDNSSLTNGPKKLDNIEIQSKNSQTNVYSTLQKYQFYYSYFTANNSTVNDKNSCRLKLDKISNALAIDQPEETIFTYSDIQLPLKNSKSVDYWGYFNGKTNYSRIPHQVIRHSPLGYGAYYESIGDADRKVDATKIEAGILKQIKYPTKGYTKFEYEPNTYFGVDKFDKFNIHTESSNTIQGTGIGSVDPSTITSPGIDNIPICTAPNPNNCVVYNEIPFDAINANGTLTFQVVKDDMLPDSEVHYRYARVRIYTNQGIVYDSNKVRSTQNFTINFNSSEGSLLNSGYILMEAYSHYFKIEGLSLKYYNNDQTLKNNLGMGLRIKSITNSENENSRVSNKQYEYTKPSNQLISSGVLVRDVFDAFCQTTSRVFITKSCDLHPVLNIPLGTDWKETKTESFNSNSVEGIESNSVVYSDVIEKKLDQNDIDNGYTKYTFNTESDFSYDTKGVIRVEFGHKRGKLISQEIFKKISPSNYVITNKTINNYFEDSSKISYITGFKLFQHAYLGLDSYLDYLPIPLDSMLEPVSYSIPVKWFYQKSSENTDYFYNQNNILTGEVKTTTTFNYNNPLHLQLSSQVTTDSNGLQNETKYFYPQDIEMINEPVRNDLIDKNIIAIPIVTQNFKAGEKLSELKTIYKNWGNDLLKPELIQTSKGSLPLENRIRYSIIDNSNGNPLELMQENGTVVTYIWGYNKTQPIAKVENATNAQVETALGMSLSSVSEVNMSAINNLRTSLPNSIISTFTYIPLIGIQTITDPKGDTLTYFYDSLGRLISVKDKNGNTLSENQYHFKN